MAKKTNKTSHVMDLLTNGASPETESAEPVAEVPQSQEKKSDVQSHTVTPAKVTVVDEGSINDRVSQEILGELTKELEEETKQVLPAGGTEAAAPQAQDTVDEPSAPQVEDTAAGTSVESPAAQDPAAGNIQTVPKEAGEENGETENVSEEPAAPEEPKNQEPKKQPHPIIPESHFGSHTQNKEYRFVNVMEQLLMRQDLDAVLKQHNVCTCPRCMSDVCALALTGLPPKYVVTSKDSISPLLSYYENKYKIPVLTELMKACNKVRENPRHKKS